MQKMFQGLYTALITPFLEDLSIDFDSLFELIVQQYRARVDGIVLFGTTGENMTLTYEEKILILKYVLELVDMLNKEQTIDNYNDQYYKLKIVVGTGTNCTKTTIMQSLQVAEYDIDGIMIVTPYYNRPSQDGIYYHYKAINDAVNIPIMMYNVPTRTGINMNDETIIKLFELENIVALKDYDSLRPIKIYTKWLEKYHNKKSYNYYDQSSLYDCFENHKIFTENRKFTILAGDDINSLSIYINGGHGCVSVASNIIPQICYTLHSEMKLNNIRNATILHANLYNLYEILFCETNPVPVKYLAYKLGLISNPLVRQPLHQLMENNKININNIIQTMLKY